MRICSVQSHNPPIGIGLLPLRLNIIRSHFQVHPRWMGSSVAMTQSGRLSPCRELCALTPPMIFKRLHAAFPMCSPQSWCQLCCWMPRTTCYSTTLSLGTLPTTKWCSLYHLICLQISALLSLDCPHETLLSFTDRVGNGVTSLWHTVRLVLLSSSTSSLLMNFCTHGSSTSNSFFILFHPLPLRTLSYLTT